MKKALLILGISLVSFAVFAAVKTTFYGPIDMQNNRIDNLGDGGDTSAVSKGYVKGTFLPIQGTSASSHQHMEGSIHMGGYGITHLAEPESAQDATTKSYVDLVGSTKLDLSGGTMTGEISMGGEKITSLASPTASNDAATKSYVDTTVAESVKPGYQYFALRRGGQYKPLISISDSITGDFWAVVIRPFTGSVTTYTDNVTLKASHFYSTKMWKVGEAVKIPYTLYQEVSAKTNAALTMVASNGGVGNWGVTFPAINPGPTFMAYFGTTAYTPGTPVDISSYVSSEGLFTFGITNCTSSAISALSFSYTLKQYATSSSLYLNIYPHFPGTINAHECVWFNCEFSGFTDANGAIWNFSIYNNDTGYSNFGPYFVPNR